MKTKLIFSGVIAFSFLLSCSRIDEAPAPLLSGKFMRFSAFWAEAPGSRTAICDTSQVWWMPGEQINLFYGSKCSSVFTSVNTEPAAITDFVGSFNLVTGAGEESDAPSSAFFAIYPYNEQNSCDGEVLTLSLSHEQIGVDSTFADKFFPAVACSNGLELGFFNICGGVCFSFSDGDVQRVVFTSSDSSPMAGRLSVSFPDGRHPEIGEIRDAVDSIVVTAPEGGFKPKVRYFAAMIPQTHLDGLDYRMYTSKMCIAGRVDHPVTVKRSTFGVLNNMDSMHFVDPEVERICIKSLDSDKDSVFTYSDAAAVTTLGNAFKGNTVIETFPELIYFTSITSLQGAFMNCSNLRSVEIPESVTTLGNETFLGCKSLEHITIPPGVTSIGLSCFSGCAMLSSVDLSEGLETVNSNAFLNCTGLKSIKLPSSVRMLDSYAFGTCKSLTNFEFPESLVTIGANCFENCSSIGQIDLSPCQGLTKIGNYAFSGCTGISGYKDIVIPSSVTSIGSKALTPFRYVTLLSTVPPSISSDSFYGSVRIGVPDECIDLYKTTTKSSPWYSHSFWIYPNSSFYPPYVYMEDVNTSLKRLHLFDLSYDFIKITHGSYTNANGNTVTLTEDYWLGKTEITRELWIVVMKADPSENKVYADLPPGVRCPVESVSWKTVQTYISQLKALVSESYRLPTEAQWEFAARGGIYNHNYIFSGSDTIDDVGYYFDNSLVCLSSKGAKKNQPNPVAGLAPNELGLYDMTGNVLEWVNDYYSSAAPKGTDPTGPKSSSTGNRVTRGGYYGTGADYCRNSYRSYAKQDAALANVGFRLAL